MKYALLIYQDDQQWADADAEQRAAVYAEHGAFIEMLKARNAWLGGEELALARTATMVRKSEDGVAVTDGPFAETHEQFGGFYLVEAADMDEALEFARALPSQSVEIRAIVELAPVDS
ncbi:MAG TPA: YciI family protein [Jiangellaceae bacterium]